MAVILSIETSTNICSAVLSKNKEVLLSKICKSPQNHAIKLPLFLKEIINFAHQNEVLPDAVAVSAGPGSYTGLRIGVSSAKGLCYALEIPLISIDTLQIMALEAHRKIKGNVIYFPMIDARRMEVYTAYFDKFLNKKTDTQAKIIDENSFAEELCQYTVVFCGNGSDKCKDIINSKNAVFLKDIHPLSINMIDIALDKFNNKEFENTAYFEPFYLKEFIANKSKTLINKII